MSNRMNYLPIGFALEFMSASTEFELVEPAPIEAIRLPVGLDGHRGSNCAPHLRAQIAADNDIDALKAWLTRFVDTKTIFDNYRNEA
jgi:integrase/recombinase XerD